MSKKSKSPITTRIKRFFNIDVEAKKYYPKDYPEHRPTPVVAFNTIKHHSDPSGRRNGSYCITYKQAA